MKTLKQLKIDFEERFQTKWTSLSILYHFKSIASHILNLKFNEVLFHLDLLVSAESEFRFHELCNRLEKDEPLQHVVGETEFMGLTFICSPKALIPRPETEELVELLASKLEKTDQPKILDLCTGSGCIAISLSKLVEKSEVIGVDYYEDTLDLAKLNGVKNQANVLWEKWDVLSKEEMSHFMDGSFTCWVSNPPYIPENEKFEMEKNVLNFEPHEALFVPDHDPLLFYRKITEMAQIGLKEEGWLFFEIHENFGKEMIALLQENNFKNVSLIKDMQGKDRIISGQK